MSSQPVSIGAGTTKLSGRFLPATNGQPGALLHVARMFTAAPFVDVGMQRMMGHSTELHTLARAFYMKILAFVEECIVYRLNQASL